MFASLDEALARDDGPACATIAASTPLHYELATPLLERRIPTLVEKPIASTAAQARALIALAERSRTVFTVGHVERFNPGAVAARRIVTDKLIGETIQLCFRRVGGSPLNPDTALSDVLVDLAVHDYDLARFITGGALEIVATLGHREGERLDGALILGRLSSGASMQLQVNWRTPVKIRRIELTGYERLRRDQPHHAAGRALPAEPALGRELDQPRLDVVLRRLPVVVRLARSRRARHREARAAARGAGRVLARGRARRAVADAGRGRARRRAR